MEYKSVLRDSQVELIVNKSRFLAWARRTPDEDSALDTIRQAKETYPDATHHCYGFIVGEGGNTVRFSDDGEPGGTAGMPILQVIQKRGLKSVTVVVTRYFGGIKLGAGGLVRAYGNAAGEALDAAGVAEVLTCPAGRLTVEYGDYGTVEHWLSVQGVPVTGVEYGPCITVMVTAIHGWESLAGQLIELTAGRIRCEQTGTAEYMRPLE
jgi:uncharacterized YigZ family protein